MVDLVVAGEIARAAIHARRKATTGRGNGFKLVGVARACMEELLEDFNDYLRTHHCRVWSKNSPEAVHMRKLGKGLPKSEKTIIELAQTRKAPAVCNISICLIHQTNYLLDQQLRHQEARFRYQGGIRERMYHARRLIK